MKIEDDLKMHSHYIEDLFKSKDETIEAIGGIKEKLNEMKEKIGLHAYAHSIQDENILKCITCNAEMAKKIEDVNKVVDAISYNVHSKFYLYEFIKDLLKSPKNWAASAGFIILIEVTIGFSELLRHVVGLS